MPTQDQQSESNNHKKQTTLTRNTAEYAKTLRATRTISRAIAVERGPHAAVETLRLLRDRIVLARGTQKTRLSRVAERDRESERESQNRKLLRP